VKHLDEAAHVRALVFLGQVHVHVDGSNGALGSIAAVFDAYGVAQVFYADFIDGDITVIPLILNIFHDLPI